MNQQHGERGRLGAERLSPVCMFSTDISTYPAELVGDAVDTGTRSEEEKGEAILPEAIYLHRPAPCFLGSNPAGNVCLGVGVSAIGRH